jgi:hypothetical protein
MVSIIFIILAAIFYSIQWTLQFHYNESYFVRLNPKFWDPQISWTNKYKNNDPKQGEKFFGSTTFLVMLSDGFHFFQTLFLTCIFIAIGLNSHLTPYKLVDIILLKSLFSIIFEILFKKNL